MELRLTLLTLSSSSSMVGAGFLSGYRGGYLLSVP